MFDPKLWRFSCEKDHIEEKKKGKARRAHGACRREGKEGGGWLVVRLLGSCSSVYSCWSMND